MDYSQSLSLINVLLLTAVFISGGIFASMLMVIGYWAGRNSRELPFRSANSPRREKPPEFERKPIDEPEGDDIYSEAAYGRDTSPMPTIMQGRG